MAMNDESDERAAGETQADYNRRRGDRRRTAEPIPHEERRAEGRRRPPGIGALLGALFARRT